MPRKRTRHFPEPPPKRLISRSFQAKIEAAFQEHTPTALTSLAAELPRPLSPELCNTLQYNLNATSKRGVKSDLHTSLICLTQILFKDLADLLQPQQRDHLVHWLQSALYAANALTFFIFNLGNIVTAGWLAESSSNLTKLPIEGLLFLSYWEDSAAYRHTHLTDKRLSQTFQGLRLLSVSKVIDRELTAPDIIKFAEQLLLIPNPASCSFSILIHNLGKMGEAKLLQAGWLSTDLINQLLQKILALPGDEQALTNSLGGLGQLAHSGNFSGKIANEDINKIMDRLCEARSLTEKAIGQCVYSLGRLAQNDCLEAPVNSLKLNALIKILLSIGENKITSYNASENNIELEFSISNVLAGLGTLAWNNQLQGPIDSVQIHDLFILVASIEKSTTLKAITLALDGIGRIAHKGQLTVKVSAELIHLCFQKLIDKPIKQLIGKKHSLIFMAVSYLAESGNLDGSISNQILITIIKKLLLLRNFDAIEMGHFFNVLGKLSATGKLCGELDNELIQTMIERLPTSSPRMSAETLSNIMIGLSLMVEKQKISFPAASQVQQLLTILAQNQKTISFVHISASFFSLGRIASAGRIEKRLSSDCINSLLAILLSLEKIDTRAISNTLGGLSKTVQAGGLRAQTDIDIELIKKLIARLDSLQVSKRNAKEILTSLAILINQRHVRVCSEENLQHWLLLAMSSHHLNPDEIIGIIHTMTLQVQKLNPFFDNTFKYLVEKLSSHINYLDPILKKQLKTVSQQIDHFPAWKQLLHNCLQGTPVPVPVIVPNHHEGRAAAQRIALPPLNDNPIFKAISEKNMHALKRLLQLPEDNARASTNRENRPPRARTVPMLMSIPRPKDTDKTIDQLVSNFFYEQEPQALRLLITESPAAYFIQLLQACSAHQLYKLAIAHQLNPLIIYLSLDNLITLLPEMISPLQIYRDHNALLAIINALTQRLALNPREKTSIMEMQTTLFARGLSYHRDCKHHNVEQKLLGCQAQELRRIERMPASAVSRPQVSRDVAPLPTQSLSQGKAAPKPRQSTPLQPVTPQQRTANRIAGINASRVPLIQPAFPFGEHAAARNPLIKATKPGVTRLAPLTSQAAIVPMPEAAAPSPGNTATASLSTKTIIHGTKDAPHSGQTLRSSEPESHLKETTVPQLVEREKPLTIPAVTPDPTPLNTKKTPERKVNYSYVYNGTDVHTLLNIRFLNKNNVRLLPPQIAEQAAITFAIQGFFLQSTPPDTRTRLLLPITVGNYWVGLNIQILQGKIISATYHTTNAREDDSTRKNMLIAALKDSKYCTPAFQLKDAITDQQHHDDRHSAPFLIENFYCYSIKSKWLESNPDLLMKQIRNRHLELLYTNKRDYYKTFNGSGRAEPQRENPGNNRSGLFNQSFRDERGNSQPGAAVNNRNMS